MPVFEPFRTLVASSGEEALELLDPAASGAIELMLTDVLMPGMTGLELAARVRALRPDLPILLMSGYSEEAIGEVSKRRCGHGRAAQAVHARSAGPEGPRGSSAGARLTGGSLTTPAIAHG
jgi:CheY-like chemotaxis protein